MVALALISVVSDGALLAINLFEGPRVAEYRGTRGRRAYTTARCKALWFPFAGASAQNPGNSEKGPDGVTLILGFRAETD